MMMETVIAVDAMGGDNAPDMTIAGADIVRKRYPDVRFLFYGDEKKLQPLLAKYTELQPACDICHTEIAISNHVKPAEALRSRHLSSMYLALDAVRKGRAEAIVSAGNTGALMALAKRLLKMLPGIYRPAIISFFPTQRSESVMLDLGANVDCDQKTLVQFAVMGAIFAKIVLAIQKPTIGLLNIGSEDVKGPSVLKSAAQSLRERLSDSFEFYGFIEGNDITLGTVDVIVTDGFTGNIALKTAEGTVRLYKDFLRRTFQSSFWGRLGYFLARPAFKKLQIRMDPRRYNGGVFIGLKGVCIKSHGNTDAFGFASAMGMSIDLIKHRLNEKITFEIRDHSSILLQIQ